MAEVDLSRFNNIMNSYLNSFNTSALAAERQASREANAFSANQAALDRAFQQTSAQRAMDFEERQAAALREFNARQAAIDRDFQQASSDKQMDFQRDMANTVYQRAVADLRQAGLSPLLAYSNLNTAAATGSSASGALASGAGASGFSAGGSRASGFKANYAAAKQADLNAFSEGISNLVFGASSAKSFADSSFGKKTIADIGRFVSQTAEKVRNFFNSTKKQHVSSSTRRGSGGKF